MFVSTEPTVDPRWLVDLNDQQRAAVLHEGGPLQIVAGAGSGKTRTLAARVAHLIDAGAPPERILLLTFTRRAAAEMIRRAEGLLGGPSAARVWGGTFHSVAYRLLRRHGAAVGLSPGFTILDQADSADLFGLVRAELGHGSTQRRFPAPATIAAVYSRVVNASEPLDEVLAQRFPWCADHEEALREIFRSYTDEKRRLDVVDYDDLLLYWLAVMESPEGSRVAAAFDHVLVDEFQDTNRLQGDILHLLAGDSGNLTVVGDDAQAIYLFRAASTRNMAEFADRYRDATVVLLEQNYRSTAAILAAANAVISESADVMPKRLWTERSNGKLPELFSCRDEAAQADLVCSRVLQRREEGVALREQCVLFRTGHHSAGLEIELARRDIPFVKFGGLRFLEIAHVKDVLAMLRMAENPRDELAWHRVLRLLPGIGPARARALHTEVVADDRPPPEALGRVAAAAPPEARRGLHELAAALADMGSADLRAGAHVARMSSFCELTFPEVYEDAGVRLEDVARLAGLADEAGSRAAFLAAITLDPPVSSASLAGPPHLDDDYLILSTIHSAKGGEWRDVYMIHASDGNIPSDMALGELGGLEEERRLLYVALTRARDRLLVVAPQLYYHQRFGASAAHGYAPLSRFLTGAASSEFVRPAAEPGPGGEEREGAAAAAADPVRPRLEALWG